MYLAYIKINTYIYMSTVTYTYIPNLIFCFKETIACALILEDSETAQNSCQSFCKPQNFQTLSEHFKDCQILLYVMSNISLPFSFTLNS